MSESTKSKPEPKVMQVEVLGQERYVCGYTYSDLVNRANERFGVNWHEVKVMTQSEALNV